ncbi:MAG: 2-C-methyl-D-erythritol 2,4-cyclodiphosphate synthase [Clostridiales bacterium]|nr:2-C-methyl-D-erythritol 2,4-cyclodiphosphate synthase [Clostridiales bacterium]
MRIGQGYDVHKLLKSGGALVLGGVHIPFDYGLVGHSDADVAVHALIDAILGALGLGDIGLIFPDNSDEYLGISSLLLLERVRDMMISKGYSVGNADITIVAQLPKIMPFAYEMRSNIAKALRTDITRISVKATTEEGLGFTGRGEGIAAHAVVLLEEKNESEQS